MSLTRINSANAFTGTIPAANFANATLDNVTSLPNTPLGDMVLISSATASASASIDFSLGNYKEYKFFFVNIDGVTSNTVFQFNFSTDNGSNYNVTKTSAFFQTYHHENDSSTSLEYNTSLDLAQSTGFQAIGGGQSTDASVCDGGFLTVFNPSSNIYVKHYLSITNTRNPDPLSVNKFVGGYANTTSPLTNIRFQFASGNIDAGKILMFGLN